MAGVRYGFRLEVTSTLPADLGRIPMSVEMDFGRLLQDVEAKGVFDPNSIEIVDLWGSGQNRVGDRRSLPYGL